MRYAVIMAGGAGTRLWPMSRRGKPKQLLKFMAAETPGGPMRSLLSLAVLRLKGLVAPEAIYICTGASYAQAVMEDLPFLPAAQLLGEPMGRDTANAVGFSAAVLAKRDPEAVMAILTADHVIEPIEVFQAAMRKGFEAVEKHPEYLVTFGITPTWAAECYGYVQRAEELNDLPGVFRVQAFKEKPNAATAAKYIEAGTYAWNSGMFIWKARTILEQLQKQLPDGYAGLMKIAEAWGTPRQNEVLGAVYPTLPKISIDFAVMEKAPHVATVAMPVKWLDVGSWPSFGETLGGDAEGHRTAGARVVHTGSTNVLAVSEVPGHLVATINCHDLIIVHTPHATLVCPAKDAEKIKAMVAEVEKTHGKEWI